MSVHECACMSVQRWRGLVTIRAVAKTVVKTVVKAVVKAVVAVFVCIIYEARIQASGAFDVSDLTKRQRWRGLVTIRAEKSA